MRANIAIYSNSELRYSFNFPCYTTFDPVIDREDSRKIPGGIVLRMTWKV